MTRSLDPLLPARLTDLATSARNRLPLLRRLFAAGLALAGAGLLVRGSPAAATVDVAVARDDLRPGVMLSASDIQIVHRARDSLPAGAIHDVSHVVGHTLAGPARTGEIFTDVRLLSPRLAPATTGTADARVVPVRLADGGVAELLHSGDRVDVITTVDKHATVEKHNSTSPRTLAPSAIVILVTLASGGSRGTSERIVLLALPAQQAALVAAASLSSALTVVLR